MNTSVLRAGAVVSEFSTVLAHNLLNEMDAEGARTGDGSLQNPMRPCWDQMSRWVMKALATTTDDFAPVNPFQMLQDDVAEWAEKTFVGQTIEGKAAHLLQEAEELRKEPKDLSEQADVLILLVHINKMSGSNVHELLAAAFAKLELCKKRKWPATPDANGVFHHLEPEIIPDDKFLNPEDLLEGDLMDRLPSAKGRN